MNQTPVKDVTDRRCSRRYSLVLPLFYAIVDIDSSLSGAGLTRDISSNGITFVAETELTVGAAVDVRIEWPAFEEGLESVQLHMVGRVVRSANRQIAARIIRHEFVIMRQGLGDSRSVTLNLRVKTR
jgi:hypothetical protein